MEEILWRVQSLEAIERLTQEISESGGWKSIQKYEDAMKLEKTKDNPEIPKILEFAPTTLQTNIPKLLESEFEKIVIDSKIAKLNAIEDKTK